MTKLEEIARAICGQNPVINYDMGGNVGDVVRTIFLERARAVLSALKTPTPEMIDAGQAVDGTVSAADVWSAMIGAAGEVR